MADNKPVHSVRIPVEPTERVLYEIQESLRNTEGMAPLTRLRRAYAAIIAHGKITDRGGR